MRKKLFLLGAALLAEAALLGLGHWQWRRYHQRLTEQAQAAARPPSVLQGTYWPTVAALTNQPNPQVPEQSGWRMLGLLEVSGAQVIINRGYAAPKFNPDNTPNFMALQPPTGPQNLQGVWVPLPKRKGWLQGPDVTTHPKLLAFLNPTLLTSATLAPQQFVLTAPDTTNPELTAHAPATANPQRHFAYMVQWLLMAAIFPLLCAAAFRRRRRA